jgi:two-component system KDP operon response regulator KdpE
MGELTARIRALLRDRHSAHAPATSFKAGPLHLDLQRHEVSLSGEPVKLSRKEFDLLALLLANRGKMLTHKQILREVWGAGHEEDTHYLRVYVGQLRRSSATIRRSRTSSPTSPGLATASSTLLEVVEVSCRSTGTESFK